MKKKEKNDTDVFGTKEQTGKEKKRKRSKYYARKKIRKNLDEKSRSQRRNTGKNL